MGVLFPYTGNPQWDSGAATADVAQARVLLDEPAPGESVKKWVDTFFLNQVYGAFCLNVFADIFVRLCFLLCTSLALLRCWRARERETTRTDLQIQQSFDRHLENQKRVLETYFRSDSFIRRVSHAKSADRASSSGEQLSPKSPANGLPTDQGQKGKGVASSEPVLPKRRNGFVYDHAPDSSSADQNSTSQTARTVTEPHVDPCDSVVIDIPTIFVFPDSKASVEGLTGDLFKPLVKDKVGVSCGPDIFSSRILQAMVPATDENLAALRDLAVEGMKLDNGFTLQIGGSFLYRCDGDPEEPVLLSLRDVEMPTVLQADYSAGVLTIRGIHLEGAEIRAATFDGYMMLTCTKQDQINNNIAPESKIEVWRCTDLLPPVNTDHIKICASKLVLIDGHGVTVRSEVTSIQNTTLRTVIRSWVPTFILILFLASQAWVLLASLLNLVVDPLHRTWILYPALALAIYTIQLLPPSLEDTIKSFVERVKLAILCLQVLPDIFSAPIFFMRNGYCFRRGAKYLVDGKIVPGGPRQGSVNPKSGCDPKRTCDRERRLDRKKNDKGTNNDSLKKGIFDKEGKMPLAPKRSPDRQGELPHSSISDVIISSDPGIPSRSRDWKWTCLKKSPGGNITRRFDPDSKEEYQQEEEWHGLMDPFTVKYKSISIKKGKFSFPVQYIPEDTSVKLYSKHLQAVTRKLLPGKLQVYEKYGEIKAKYLLVSYIRQDLEKESGALLALNHDVKNEGECLDMFHLIRFLRKEFAEIITQYERMRDAAVASYDMLWTLIWPNADVVYYCGVSNQELCGKVVSIQYDSTLLGSKFKGNGGKRKFDFNVELETYDYDSESMSFEVKKVSCVISPFLEEVEIHKLIICPLQFKANPETAEEFFLSRGRRYFDLALKYERKFMHYQGRLFKPSRDSRPSAIKNRRMWGSSGIRYENIDGRVMIDQGVWVAMHKDTVESRREKTGDGPPLQIKPVLDEFDPLLKYAPAVVYGYSFSKRRWGCFMIDGFSKIQFISTAFDTLVMNEDIKRTLLALTRHYIKHPQGSENALTNVDPLPNKGKGCIILLHGAPGTGKTLTVESLAEKLECPLWQLSVTSRYYREELEKDLHRTFEIAASWKAILVLDEADVYLASRKYSPLSSDVTSTNAMTGVFLRVLEYYTGILFLTTNVLESIEPAVFSRMSLLVKYEEFNINDRKQLWINFLNHIDFQHPSDAFWNVVLAERFNGRVIRNIIQNAQILAQSTGSLLSEEHLLNAFQVMATPNSTSHAIEIEAADPDPTQTSTTMSTYTPSVVTD